MRKLLLLGALALFAFTASAQSDAPASTEKAKTEKVCAKTGKTCSATCANKKTETCCEGKSDAEKKSCSKADEKSSCSKTSTKDGDKKSCAKAGEKSSCSKSCTKTEEKTKETKIKGAKKTGFKAVGMSK